MTGRHFRDTSFLITEWYVCMYRGRPSCSCPRDWVFQLGQGEGTIGIMGPISQPRGTVDTASLTLYHTHAFTCAF